MSAKPIYPYEIASNAIELRLDDPSDPTNPGVDLNWVKAQLREDEPPRLDLRTSAEWRRLEFGVEVRLAPDHLKRVLPPGSDYRKDTAMIVSIRCPTTKTRYPVGLVADSAETGRWTGELEFDRRDVASRVEFVPMLYRKTAIPDSAPVPEGITRRRGALLAFGRPTGARIDDTGRTPKGWVKIAWEDFRSSPNEWRALNDTTLYFLEVDPDQPTLWLNERHTRIRALLFEANPRGPSGAIHHMLVSSLAETVWNQLFHASIVSVNRSGPEGGSGYPEGWRGEVLKKYLPQMFPDLDDPDAQLRRAVSMMETPDQWGGLIGLATTVTQGLMRSDNLFREAIRCIENLGDAS